MGKQLLAQDFTAIQNNAGISTLMINAKPAQIISNGTHFVFAIAGVVLLLNIISSGLKLMTSHGDPKTFQAAQSKMTTSVVGVLILSVSYFIVQAILKFFGINITLFVF